MKKAMQALLGALVLVFAAQVFAEPAALESDLDGNASALQSS
jgi:hypothetical protein